MKHLPKPVSSGREGMTKNDHVILHYVCLLHCLLEVKKALREAGGGSGQEHWKQS